MTKSTGFTADEITEWPMSPREERKYTEVRTPKGDAICFHCHNPVDSRTAVAGEYGLCDVCNYRD